MLKVWEMVLNPSIDVFQCHALLLSAIDGKLDHGHVGIGWTLSKGPLREGSPGGRC